MLNCKSIINEVEFSYLTRRSDKEFKLTLLRERLLKIPEYKETAEKLSTAIFDCNKSEFDQDYEKARALKAEIKRLKEIKLKIEKENGADIYLPDCEICNDYGEVDGEKCQCFYDKTIDACYAELSVTKPSLFSFNDDKLPQGSQIKKYYEKFKKYAENFSSASLNVVFTGKTGTGKTCLGQAVANDIAKRKNVALFLSASSLVDVYVENMYSSPASAKITNDVLETCDFLVIDDLGAERLLNKVTVENLYVLISRRLELKKPFLITTNLTMQELNARYGDRLFSRITSNNTVTFNFDGDDLRKKL